VTGQTYWLIIFSVSLAVQQWPLAELAMSDGLKRIVQWQYTLHMMPPLEYQLLMS